jgi:hypothetical protein
VARRCRLVRREVRRLRFDQGEPKAGWRSPHPDCGWGNSDPALRRAAAWADGWYGFNLAGVDAVRERVDKLERLCAESGRDRGELRLAVALDDPGVDDVGALCELGVDEFVLVEAPPDQPEAAAEWVSALADRWISRLAG